MMEVEAVPQSYIRWSLIGMSTALHMRSLLLVRNFDLHLGNQYILVRAVPSCFHFVFASGKSPVTAQPKTLDIFFFGELYTVYMDQEGALLYRKEIRVCIFN
jgi:hypothetical protein